MLCLPEELDIIRNNLTLGSLPIGLSKHGPQIMQTTRNFHRLIGKECLGITKDIFDNPAPFDSANDVLDHHPNAGNDLIFGFLGCGELAALGLFLGLIDRHPGRRIALKTRVLEPPNIRWKHGLFNITYPFVVDATRIRFTQIAYPTLVHIDDEVVFR